ncbi:hypothetical protein ACLOJK_018464 [Asimina triloba]
MELTIRLSRFQETNLACPFFPRSGQAMADPTKSVVVFHKSDKPISNPSRTRHQHKSGSNSRRNPSEQDDDFVFFPIGSLYLSSGEQRRWAERLATTTTPPENSAMADFNGSAIPLQI